MSFRVVLAVAAVAMACVHGCGAGSSQDGDGGANSSNPSGSAGAGVGGDVFTGVGGAGAGNSSGIGGGCASETVDGTGVPLDMFIMLDQSGSMGDSVQGGTKWTAVTGAINNYMALPASAGIGVGIQYFPLTTGGLVCNPNPICFVDGDCGAPGCGPCFGAIPPSFPGICMGALDTDSCNVADYATPDVAIAPLPGVATAITASMAAHSPTGGTPTAPALQGAIDHATAHAMANPSHVVLVVLATDGDPTSCTPTDIPGIQAIAAAGFNASPSILTFVIGVGNLQANLDAIAQSGGSNAAFIVDTNQNVEQQFLDALEQIKGTALGCAYAIPVPTMGNPDFNQVNVEWTPPGGDPQIIPKVTDPSACPPNGPGWYYNDAQNPTQILLCPYSCNEVEMASEGGQVRIVLGCETIVE
ncbi:MAG: hypothetical protein KC731_42945 [Myxococcales bacterium]|nr:hypothetical protein [Myxococcales bacterium]